MTSALPYALAVLGLLIVSVALDWMRSAGFANPEIRTVGAAVIAAGAVLFMHLATAAWSRKR